MFGGFGASPHISRVVYACGCSTRAQGSDQCSDMDHIHMMFGLHVYLG